MAANTRTFLVTTSRDIHHAITVGLPCVQLIYRVGADGSLLREQSTAPTRGSLMGLYDRGEDYGQADVNRLARDVLAEYQRRGYQAVVLDFENPYSSAGLVHGLCNVLSQRNIVHFVPLVMANQTQNGKIIVPSAISGGSYSEMLETYVQRYGAGRLCLDLVRTCSDFEMPAFSPEGKMLSAGEFKAICDRVSPSFYFSPELCAKYFTYRENGKSHFLLFDDPGSAAKKLSIARDMGFYSAFLLYSDWGRAAREIVSR